MLGPPRTDAEGRTLYRHKDGTIDAEKGEDGVEVRDLQYVTGSTAEKQIILNRLRTETPDWFHHPLLGANLSDLIGEPNTKETAEKGAIAITNALLYGGMYDPQQVHVRPIPVNQEEILFLIRIHKSSKEVFQLPLVFNLTHGLLYEYEVKS